MIQDWHDYYDEVKALTRNIPGLRARGEHGEDQFRWVGRLRAAVKKLGDQQLLTQVSRLPGSSSVADRNGYAQAMLSALFSVLAEAESHNPQSSGLFIPVGGVGAFEAALDRIVGEANVSVWIIDPYVDAKAISVAQTRVKSSVSLRILGDAHRPQSNLPSAAAAWRARSGAPLLEVRMSPSKALHDRLIVIDGGDVWNCSQSLKDFANRSPGAIEKSRADVAALKVAAYEQIWTQSTNS